MRPRPCPIEHTPRRNRSGFRAPERSDDAHHVYRRYNRAALFGIPEEYPHSDLAKGRHRGHGQYAVTPCQRSGGNTSRRRHRAAVSAAVQPRYESD